MDVKEADGSYDKDSDKLKCATENDLFRLSQDLRKQHFSILESFEPVFITDESAFQHELTRVRNVTLHIGPCYI